MKALLFALPIILVFFAGWVAHAWLVRRRPALNSQERVELDARKELDYRLEDICMDHIESEPFAAIVLDEVRKTNKIIVHRQIDVLHRKDPE
jgi:hypothetical protein